MKSHSSCFNGPLNLCLDFNWGLKSCLRKQRYFQMCDLSLHMFLCVGGSVCGWWQMAGAQVRDRGCDLFLFSCLDSIKVFYSLCLCGTGRLAHFRYFCIKLTMPAWGPHSTYLIYSHPKPSFTVLWNMDWFQDLLIKT